MPLKTTGGSTKKSCGAGFTFTAAGRVALQPLGSWRVTGYGVALGTIACAPAFWNTAVAPVPSVVTVTEVAPASPPPAAAPSMVTAAPGSKPVPARFRVPPVAQICGGVTWARVGGGAIRRVPPAEAQLAGGGLVTTTAYPCPTVKSAPFTCTV